MAARTRDALREFWASGSGKVGAAFFLILLAVSVYVLLTYPLDFGLRYWSNPSVWADNPKAASPAWVNMLSDFRMAEHRVFESTEPANVVVESGVTVCSYVFAIDHQFDEPPTFTSFTMYNVTYHARPPVITVILTRPDDKEIRLYELMVPGPRPGEEAPVTRYQETPLRVHLSGESAVASEVSAFLRQEFGVSVAPSRLLMEGVDAAIFGVPREGNVTGFQVLRGTYRVSIRATLYDPADSIGMVRFVTGGSVYGFMGTDGLGRDLAVGLLFGFPVALFIGLVTSTLTTLIGALLGIVSGYKGGRTDLLVQRGCDILVNVPLLPILIFLSFILGQKLWVVILILIAFGWPGLTIVVRSMVLQIRSSQFVEAAVALGASQRRIMLRHILPQIAPFVFSQLIFFTPSAILAEAALSFLGLGDPSLPTWGQILEYGFRSGGVYVGYWWWVVPPGVLIVLTAITFVLIALGMEPVVNPRLRRMR